MAPLSWQSNRANFMNGLERGQDQDCFIEEQVRTDRLHQLFRQSFAAILGSYLAAVRGVVGRRLTYQTTREG